MKTYFEPAVKTYQVITTLEEAKTAISQIHNYLDTVRSRSEKERIAFDIETYLCYEARYEYNLRYSLKACRKKAVKEWAATIFSQLNEGTKASLIDLSEAPEGFEFKEDPELPVPEPVKNKRSVYEARIRLFQVGLNPKHLNLQYVFDLDKIAKADFSISPDTAEDVVVLEFYKEIGKLFQPLFDRACTIGQYLPYEYSFLWHFFNCYLRLMRDVGLMSQILYMGDKINHKLSSLYRLYIDKEKFKTLIGFQPIVTRTYDAIGNLVETINDNPFDWYDNFKEEEQKSPWYLADLEEHQYRYAAEDTQLLWYVFEELLIQLAAWAEQHGQGIIEVVQMECELIAAIAKMKVIGFEIDVPYIEKEVIPFYQGLMDEAQAEVDKLYKRKIVTEKKRKIGKGKDALIEHYTETTYESYNLGSHQQIRALTGLDKKALETTGYKDLLFFKDKHPAIKWLIQYKKAQKALGFFTSSTSGYLTVMDGENVIHHTVHQIGKDELTIDSGRMAGSKPNLMQVDGSKRIRKAFIGAKKRKKEPYVLVIKDFHQIEPVILANETEDPFLCTCFNEGRDLHAETAKDIFKLDFLPVDGHPEDHWRKKGKVVRLARTFMMGVIKGMKDVYVKSDCALDYILRGKEGEDEFRAILENFDKLTPGVQKRQEEILAEVKELPMKYGGMYHFRSGKPFYVAKSIMGRTRRFCLSPEDRKWVSQEPERYETKLKVLYEKTGNISTWANAANTIIRDAAKNAFNNLSQSSGADICKLSIVGINRRLEALVNEGKFLPDECVILSVHDEIISQCRPCNAILLEQIMEEEMLKAAKRFIWKVPVKVAGGIGINWSESKAAEKTHEAA